jgi:hypothetical protein
VKLELSDNALDWQAKARAYADKYLQPHEVEAELNNGVLSAKITKRMRSCWVSVQLMCPSDGVGWNCHWSNRSLFGSN